MEESLHQQSRPLRRQLHQQRQPGRLSDSFLHYNCLVHCFSFLFSLASVFPCFISTWGPNGLSSTCPSNRTDFQQGFYYGRFYPGGRNGNVSNQSCIGGLRQQWELPRVIVLRNLLCEGNCGSQSLWHTVCLDHCLPQDWDISALVGNSWDRGT